MRILQGRSFEQKRGITQLGGIPLPPVTESPTFWVDGAFRPVFHKRTTTIQKTKFSESVLVQVSSFLTYFFRFQSRKRLAGLIGLKLRISLAKQFNFGGRVVNFTKITASILYIYTHIYDVNIHIAFGLPQQKKRGPKNQGNPRVFPEKNRQKCLPVGSLGAKNSKGFWQVLKGKTPGP